MTDEKDTGGPAFPVSLPGWGDNGAEGMTLRDYFAGQALAGIIADGEVVGGKVVARASFEYADAMIAERNKRRG